MLLMISFIPVMLWSVGLSLSDLTAGTSGMGAETDWKATLLPVIIWRDYNGGTAWDFCRNRGLYGLADSKAEGEREE